MRNNPQEYAKKVENHLKYLVRRNNDVLYEHGGYTVLMDKGEESFKRCIEYLYNAKALEKFKSTDTVRIVVPDKLDLQDKPDELIKEIREKFPEKKIEFNFVFILPKPEMIVILMLLDDKGKNCSIRDNLLNEAFLYLGISVKKSKGKEFCLYLTFSD